MSARFMIFGAVALGLGLSLALTFSAPDGDALSLERGLGPLVETRPL